MQVQALGDLPITPRIGKPVEVQALWLNPDGTFTREKRSATLSEAKSR